MAAGAYGWRPTTLVVPNVKKIRSLNLHGTPWATSVCYGMTLLLPVQVKQSITGLDKPRGFQEVEAPRFQDNRHMKVVRLSALRTGLLYPRKYSWYSFLLEAESTPGLWTLICGTEQHLFYILFLLYFILL